MALLNPPGNVTELADGATQARLAEGWSAVISSFVDSGVARVGGAAGRFFNPGPGLPAGQVEQAEITWEAFPSALADWFRGDPDDDRKRWATAEHLAPRGEFREVVGGNRLGDVVTVEFRQQDEYCEWFTETDARGVRAVQLTAEGPEYWTFLAMGTRAFFGAGEPGADLWPGDLDLVTDLYRRHVNPGVRTEDLVWPVDVAIFSPRQGRWAIFANRGDYNPFNEWNTRRGAMHLTHPANTLGAEVNLAADATVLRRGADGAILPADRELACCAGFGDVNRSSDPTIGGNVNQLVQLDFDVTLADPIGLYISGFDDAGVTGPAGWDAATAWRVERGEGGARRILRARFELPPDVDAADVVVDGVPLERGAQVIDLVRMNLRGVGVKRPDPRPPVVQPCATRCCSHPEHPEFHTLVGLDELCTSLTAADWAAQAPFVPEFPPSGPLDDDPTPVGLRMMPSVRRHG